MTFGNFKKLCSKKEREGYILPDDESLKLLINEAIQDIALESRIIPFTLHTNDKKYKVLRILDDEFFIRFPKEIKNDDDELDIDEPLVRAVLYEILTSNIAGDERANFYARQKEKVIQDFMWNNYYAMNNEE